ncbi:hypothetical protein A2U01_0103935, partial [Trifolium medium]|nr:hypothetical protein [Trifolium medium]
MESEERVNVVIIEGAKGRVLLDLHEDLRKEFILEKEETKTGGIELGGGGKD